jgi:hypothetical protein
VELDRNEAVILKSEKQLQHLFELVEVCVALDQVLSPCVNGSLLVDMNMSVMLQEATRFSWNGLKWLRYVCDPLSGNYNYYFGPHSVA